MSGQPSWPTLWSSNGADVDPGTLHDWPVTSKLERSHLYKKCQQLGIDVKAERSQL